VFTGIAVLERVILATFPILPQRSRYWRSDRSWHALSRTTVAATHVYLKLNLGVGTSGGVHPGAAGIRHLLGSRGYIREKTLFATRTDGLRTCSIMVCRYSSGWHHFFTMGSGANVNGVSGIIP